MSSLLLRPTQRTFSTCKSTFFIILTACEISGFVYMLLKVVAEADKASIVPFTKGTVCA